MQERKFLYIFLDEAGNFDFSPSGTRYFTLASIAKERPFRAYQELTELKYDLVELGLNLEYFHASEDVQATRNRVFEIICKNLEDVRIDSLIVDKPKTDPAFRHEERFYPEMLGQLLQDVFNGVQLEKYAEVIVFTDRIPIQKKRKAIEKAVKKTLVSMLPKNVRYRVFHHDSKSNFDLQVADYCNWAIYKKVSTGDSRSYDLVCKAIKSESDIFARGQRFYKDPPTGNA